MSASFSSYFNDSLPPPSFSSFNVYYFLYHCINSTAGSINMTAFIITNLVFLLPVYVFIIYLGFQRWRQQHTNTTMSHSDIFTYNIVVTELLSVFGSTLTCFAVYTDLPKILMGGIYLFSTNLSAQMFFHILTCVERYLAVVHPITYLSLRKAKGIRIRNITTGFIWLLSYAGTGIITLVDQVNISNLTFCTIAFMLIVISFCSLSVLCVLIRPGPGEGGGGRGRQRVDHSKLRAFYTILAILGVLVFRFAGNIFVVAALYGSPELMETEKCGTWLSLFWFSLPSSLVLPLLFLQRAGKLLCCKNNKGSGQG